MMHSLQTAAEQLDCCLLFAILFRGLYPGGELERLAPSLSLGGKFGKAWGGKVEDYFE